MVIGSFPEIPWHKAEKEHILRAVGISIEYGEELKYREDMGAFKTVGDVEHVEIMKLYWEDHSMAQIADLKNRSKSAISTQIRTHNQKVISLGYCPRCKRTEGELYDKIIKYGK